MIASSWWKVGAGLIGAAGLLASSGAGCGSSGISTSTGGETTSTGSAGGGGATGTGGSGTASTSTGSSATSSTGTGSSTGTAMVKYETCQDCTDLKAGAPADECKVTHDACFADPNCVTLYNCAYDFNTGCNTDATGACCTFGCYATLKKTLGNDAAAQKAIDEYHAYDACLYCGTCKTQCDAEPYCTAYAAGPATCPPSP